MTPNETALRLAMDLRNGTLLPSETDEAAENIEALVAENEALRTSHDNWHADALTFRKAASCERDVRRELEREVEALRAERRPLMDDQLCDLWYRQSLDWMEFARAIEAAHGITGETK